MYIHIHVILLSHVCMCEFLLRVYLCIWTHTKTKIYMCVRTHTYRKNGIYKALVDSFLQWIACGAITCHFMNGLFRSSWSTRVSLCMKFQVIWTSFTSVSSASNCFFFLMAEIKLIFFKKIWYTCKWYSNHLKFHI